MGNLLQPLRSPAGLQTAAHFAKVALLLIGTAVTIFAAAKLAIPYSTIILSATTSSPVIWITAQLIVFIVWKISQNKPSIDNDKPQQSVTPSPAVQETDDDSEILPAPPPAQSFSPEINCKPSHPQPTTMIPTEIKANKAKKPMKRSSSVKEENVSMDATWKAIVDGGANSVRRLLRKSDTWEGIGAPQVETAPTLTRQNPVAGRPEMRKSATFTGEKAVVGGWREKEALAVGTDELSRRVEGFIKMHYDHLRLQRQESEHRRRFTEMVKFNHAF